MFSAMDSENQIGSLNLQICSSEFIDESIPMLLNMESSPVEEKQQDATAKKSPKGKRFRTVFTSYQLLELEREYSINIYLCRTRRLGISNRLGIHERKVKVWFQNRRMKSRKESKELNVIRGNVETRPRSNSNASSVDSKRSSPSVDDQRRTQDDHHHIVSRLLSYTQDAQCLIPKSIPKEEKLTTNLIVPKSENTIMYAPINNHILPPPYFDGYQQQYYEYSPPNYSPYLENSCQYQTYVNSPDNSQFDYSGYATNDGFCPQTDSFAEVQVNNTDSCMNQFWESYTDFINL